MHRYKIIQLIPAPGWWAVHTEDDGTELHSPLVAWALLNNGDVIPLDTDITGYVDEVADSNLARIEYRCP